MDLLGQRELGSLLAGIRDHAISLLDVDGRIIYWNAGAERVTGYLASEMVGQPFARLYLEDDVEHGKPTNELRTAVETGCLQDEGWRVRKDGSRFWADTTITALRDGTGTLTGFAKITRDVTERRRAEERLRASEAKFRGLLELAPDGIVIADAEGRIVLANTQAHQIFGYAPDELLGQRVEVLIPASVREVHVRHRAGYHASPRTRPMGLGLDLTGRRKDGVEFPVEISLSPVQTETALLVMSAIRDLTERKASAQQIKALNEDLQRQVAELGRVNKELEAFASAVSHDLRAPLRGIDGFAQALDEEYGDRLDAQGRDYLCRVRVAAQRMGELIDNLLDLSHLSRRPMRREPVDLGALARGVIFQLRATQPERQVEVTIHEGLVTSGDSHLLRVALENLLGNAWKFTGHEPKARIEFGVLKEDGPLVYFIRDNGVGFDMAYANKLFGAFQRLHGMLEFPGTGIGLATVQRVIARHGGRVWAEATVGKGATFYFTLEPEQT